jgi:hypothetical protein
MSYGIVSAEYFWYKADDAELSAIIGSCRYADYRKWIHTKQICYTIAQVNSSKKINMDNFMKLVNPLESSPVKTNEDINMEEFKQMKQRYESSKKGQK